MEEQFDPGFQGFLNVLKNLELNPRTLGVSDYPNKAPLDEVIELMQQCKGVIVLGYPQICANDVLIKGKKVKGLFSVPTEWNHIEGSLAYSRKLPLLILHHIGIKRGVFEKGALNCFIYEIDFTKSNWAITEKTTGALTKYKSNLGNSEQISERLIVNSSEPICPNCSTADKKFMMSPIPAVFSEIEQANYECTKCHYKKMIT
jgi:hypothetical protein